MCKPLIHKECQAKKYGHLCSDNQLPISFTHYFFKFQEMKPMIQNLEFKIQIVEYCSYQQLLKLLMYVFFY